MRLQNADAWHLMVLSAAQVAAGSVQKAVIVETKKEFSRADGSLLRFDRNACVLVSDKGQPIGTRVLGFVTHELRSRNLLKVSRGLFGSETVCGEEQAAAAAICAFCSCSA